VDFTVSSAPVAGPGLRVLMGPADAAVEVVVRGLPDGSDVVELCPVGGASATPDEGGCVVATPGRAVALALGAGSGGGAGGGLRGVLVRPRTGSSGASSAVVDVTFTYRPGADSLTVVTPPLGPYGGAGGAIDGGGEMTFELTPTGRGTFQLVADGRGGRPRVTLRSGRPDSASGNGGTASSSRVVSTVEGGGRLSIRATVEGPDGVSLTLRNLGPDTLAPLELALVWPSPR
jgi:hypothetical protein